MKHKITYILPNFEIYEENITKMKVKIIKCCDNDYWYHDSIGLIFDVWSYTDDFFRGSDDTCYFIIEKCDCIDINELRLNKLNIILKNER